MIKWPKHEAEMSLTHNRHKSSYETAKADILSDTQWYDDDSFVSSEQRQQCIDTNEIWTLQWYPHTPVGFNVMHFPTLEAMEHWLDSYVPPS